MQIISIPLPPYIVSFSDRVESCRRGEAEVCTARCTVTPPSITERRGGELIVGMHHDIFHCSVKSEVRCATRRAVLSRALVPTVSLYIRDSTGISQVTWNPCATGGGGGGRRRFVCSRGQKKSCDWSRLLFEKFFVLIFRNSFSSFFFFSTNINARKRIVSFFLENLRFFT